MQKKIKIEVKDVEQKSLLSLSTLRKCRKKKRKCDFNDFNFQVNHG